MRHNRNWKKTGSAILAVCLIAALLLSNQSFGVFAEEEQRQAVTQEEVQSEAITEETGQDVEGFVSSDVTEIDEEDSSNETENDDEDIELTPEDGFYSEESSEEVIDSEQEDETEENSEEGIDLFSDDADTVTMDLYYGDITFSDDKVTYFDTDNAQKIIEYDQRKKYRIIQTNSNTATYHTISVGTSSVAVTKAFTIYLAGVNVDAPGEQKNHKAAIYVNTAENTVNLVLENKSKNTVVAHAHGKGETDKSTQFTHSAIEKEIDTKGTLRITCESGLNNKGHDCANDGDCGSLTATAKSNGGVYWNGAGIGSKGYIGNNYDHSETESTSGTMYNLVIAGGVITATGAGGSGNGGGPGIGIAQSGPDSNAVGYNAKGLEIDGGYIVARAGNGATTNIGGGFHSGYVEMTINGGYIEALRDGNWSISNNEWYQADVGAAIGGGSGGSSTSAFFGTKITINGGRIKASAAYGAAIGSSAGGANGDGAPATIIINGGNIDASTQEGYGAAIGTGGSAAQEKAASSVGKASDANITINGGIITAHSQYGADIGGGGTQSTQELAVGGNATINITNGTITTTGNGLGGGLALAGQGGNASISISGGAINTTSIGGGDSDLNKAGDASVYISSGILNVTGRIGGGNSKTGTPGAVTSENQSAGVIVTGGTLKAGTIGGGTNDNSDIGFATVYISGGNIQGQFILANTDENKNCKFTMTGGTIDNTALWSGTENSKYQMAQKNGGAVYLTDSNGVVNISGGTIQNCRAELGGAVYMTAGTVTLSETGKIKNCTATGNTEKNIEAQGGAIYLGNGTVNVSGGEITECFAVNGAAVYMQDGSMAVSGGSVKHNTATQSGAGAYLASGNLDISGGDFTENKALNGAGVYFANGTLALNGGTVSSNTATNNGGGFYLAGGQLYITDGTIQSNEAKNGAGAYVADSTVRMFGGDFTNNQASENGGGMYISSTSQAADIVIRSGNLAGNSAGNAKTTSDQGNGGAIAVVSDNSAHEDHVVIGLRKDHNISDYEARDYTAFSYNDDADSAKEHNHAACPTIKNNTATGNGGGIYMSSSASVLDIYCLLESGNKATADETGASIMSAGGQVNIGDIGDGGPGSDGTGLNNTAKAVGNIFIESKMLVKGGNVKLFGNTENPKFAGSILVDIEKGVDDGTQKGSFNDYRFRAFDDNEGYKIEYFENFEGSGKFESRQYSKTEEVRAIGNMFDHTGWKILGWDKNAKASVPTYKSNNLIPQDAWNDVDQNTGSLRLYAIWKKITFTVKYDANITGDDVSGEMPAQIFEYNDEQKLQKNTFKVKGKRFVSWNTEKNGQGTSYADEAMKKADGMPISTLISVDGDKITLYAKWKDCTHTEEDHAVLSYQVNETAYSITETCDCDGYTATVQIAGEDVYYDGEDHPAILTGRFLAGPPEIVYTYKSAADGEYGAMPNGTTIPKEIGYYKATITVKDGDEEKSVSVEYQIKSPADAATIDATIQKGEQFSAFTNNENCTVAQDDAFTVRYDVSGLNAGVNSGNNESSTTSNESYTSVPILTVSKGLPTGTTIIMLTNNEYWYNNDVSGKNAIQLDTFRKMGGSESDKFTYNTSNSQSYRFIVDFSGVSSKNYLPKDTKLKIGLKYNYTNPGTTQPDPTQDKTREVAVTINAKADFAVTMDNGNVCRVEALSDTTNTRYAGKNLVWKISPKDPNVKLPSDAEMTLSTTVGENVQTGEYALNVNGEFIIPFKWTDGQAFTFTLSSSQKALSGSDHSYALTASLCVGSSTKETAQPKAVEDQLEKVSADIALQIPINREPAMKIAGTDKVFTNTDSLHIDIKHTVDLKEYSVEAVIQKMQAGEYKGDNGRITIDALDKYYTLGLQSTTGAGSYRVCIVITNKDGHTVHLMSTEPYYYFIVQ